MKKLKCRVSNLPAIIASKGWNQIRVQSFLLHFCVFNSYYVYSHVKLFSFSKCEQVSFLKTKMKLFSPTGIVLSVETVSLGESRLFMGWDLGARRKKVPVHEVLFHSLSRWSGMGPAVDTPEMIQPNQGCPSGFFCNRNLAKLEVEARLSANPIARVIHNPIWQKF